MNRVLRFLNPVALIGVVNQPRLDTLLLENSVEGEALGHDDPIVLLAVDNERWRVDVLRVGEGAPPMHGIDVLPRCPAHCGFSSRSHVAGPLPQQFGDPGVADRCGEPVSLSNDPRHQVAPIRSADDCHAVLIDEPRGEQMVGRRHDVLHRLVTPSAADRTGEVIAERVGSVEIHRHDDISGSGERLSVPAIVPGAARSVVRSTMDVVDEGPLLGAIETRWVDDVCLYFGSAGTLEEELGRLSQLDLSQDPGVETADEVYAVLGEDGNIGRASRRFGAQPQGPQSRSRSVCVVCLGYASRGVCPLRQHEHGHPALIGGVQHEVGIRCVFPSAGRSIPPGSEVCLGSGGSVVAHQLHLVGVVIEFVLLAEGQVATIGAVAGSNLLGRERIRISEQPEATALTVRGVNRHPHASVG